MLLAACGLAAPATAGAATPVGTALQGATATVSSTAAAVDAQTGTGAPSLGQGAATTVGQVTQAPAVKTVVKTVSEPVDRAVTSVANQRAIDGDVARRVVDDVVARVPTRGVEAGGACVAACVSSAAPDGGSTAGAGDRAAGGPDSNAPRLGDRGPRAEGAIDRRAAQRQGGATATGQAALGAGDLLTALSTFPSQIDLVVAAPQPVADASSTKADSGNDSEPGSNPLFGPPAIGGSAAPTGLMVLAFAMLVGLLGVALRRVSQPLHMSPSRRGLAAILTAIERPG